MSPTRRRRFWVNLGSPNAVRAVFAGMIVYALIIGGLILGYANVQECLQDYADANARAFQNRAQASAQDRALQLRTDALALSDRQRLIANARATVILVEAINSAGLTSKALSDYQKVNEESLRIFAANETERINIGNERARVENMRASTPLPDAPSDTC